LAFSHWFSSEATTKLTFGTIMDDHFQSRPGEKLLGTIFSRRSLRLMLRQERAAKNLHNYSYAA